MNKFPKSIVAIILAIASTLLSHAGNYSVVEGSSFVLYCTATPPAGYITHAFFELTDANDAEYIGFNYTTSDCFATVYGLKPKAQIKIKVTYSYTYTGSYDNRRHVGSGSYYDYITVKSNGTITVPLKWTNRSLKLLKYSLI